jgi:hypothetical protein
VKAAKRGRGRPELPAERDADVVALVDSWLEERGLMKFEDRGGAVFSVPCYGAVSRNCEHIMRGGAIQWIGQDGRFVAGIYDHETLRVRYSEASKDKWPVTIKRESMVCTASGSAGWSTETTMPRSIDLSKITIAYSSSRAKMVRR